MTAQTTQSSLQAFRAKVVQLIMDGRVELALGLLSEHYDIIEPTVRVGTVKRHRRVLACYVEKERRIYFSNSDFLNNPFVVLHEFYHHLRSLEPGRSRQVEKRADLFAANFIRDFMGSSPKFR
jgi:hypothetical protein